MGTVALVNVDPGLRQELASRRLLQEEQFVEVPQTARPFDLPQREGEMLEAVLIGPGCSEPIRVAQRFHALYEDAPIVICTEEAGYTQLRKALRFMPLVGNDVTCVGPEDRLGAELESAIARFRQRRLLRSTVGVANEVLARKTPKRETALRYIDRLMEAAPIGVAALDARGMIMDWNRKAAELLDTSPESLSGRALETLFPKDQRATLNEVLMRARSSDREFSVSLVRRTGSRGASQFLDTRAVQFWTQSGERGVLVILQDFTGQKQAEQERSEALVREQEARRALERTNAELLRANQDLEQFAFSASHDLKEPLRMVGVYSQLLQRRYKGKLDAEADQYLNYTAYGARRMDMLVNDLLAYTQAVTVGTEEAAPIDAAAVLDSALSTLQGTIEEAGANIIVGSLPALQIQEVHLRQLFQNLIGNALKYRSDARPVIRVSAQLQGDMWRLCIEDNGIGIDPEYHDQIFGLFKRLHNSEEYEGTGIGLALCHKTVGRYGGRIWVESEGEGRGCRFFFTLPGAAVVGASTNPPAEDRPGW